MARDITILVAALNEEENIEAAIESVVTALDGVVDDYEIIVFDDGSSDRTGDLAEARARVNGRIKVVRNGVNRGIGYVFSNGIKMATKTYISCFPGDNDMAGESLRDIAKRIGETDLIVSYMAEMKRRTILRRVLSRSYVIILNGLFGLHLRYYNGPFLFKTSIAQSLEIKSTGLGIIAECIVKMLKLKCDYKQIPFIHTGRTAGKSTALSLRSFVSILHTVWILIIDIHVKPLFGKRLKCGTSS